MKSDDPRARGFEWFVAWRYLRDPDRRSFRWLIVGGALLVAAVLAVLAAALVEGHLFGSSGGLLRLRSSMIAENIRLAAVIVAGVGVLFFTFGALRAVGFSVFTSISMFGVM